MAQHGYLGEGYGMRGDHGDDDFDRGDRDFRGQDRDRGYGDRQRGMSDRDRGERERGRGGGFMMDRGRSGSGRDWNEGRREQEGWGGSSGRPSYGRGRDDDQGFMNRARNAAESWFGDDDNDRRDRHQGGRWSSQSRGDERPAFGGFGNQTGWESMQQSRPTPHRDDHYRSWREKQMEALDRDYEEYCRDCEQKFHQDFDSWRQTRQQQSGQQQSSQQSMQGGQGREDDQSVRMGSNRPSIDSPRAGTDPQGGGLNTDSSTEVGAGSQPGQGATSVGAGSELAGATGSFVNEGTGGTSGGRKKTV
jgi:hypothetical protein